MGGPGFCKRGGKLGGEYGVRGCGMPWAVGRGGGKGACLLGVGRWWDEAYCNFLFSIRKRSGLLLLFFPLPPLLRWWYLLITPFL